MTNENLADLLDRHRRVRPLRPAVVCDGREVTWARLAERVTRLANALGGLGVEPGQRVAVLATNSAEHVEVVLALARAGAVWVPVNYRLAVPEMAFLLEDSGAVALLHSPDMQDAAAELAATGAVPTGRVVSVGTESYEALLAAAAQARGAPRHPGGGHDLAIMYTSGTTGRPKGVVLTHAQLLAGTRSLALAVGAGAGDRLLETLPQFHAGGAIYQLAYLLAGATVVVLPRFEPERAGEVVRERGVTVAGLVPTMLHDLVEAAGRVGTMPTLRRVLYGGAPISVPRLRAAIDLLPVEFLQTYGLTEVGVVSHVLDAEAHRRGHTGPDERLLRSCGRVIAGYEARLMPDQPGGALPGPAAGAPPGGRVGEVHVRSASVMRGYWRRPEETAKTLVDGWLRTGDLATEDDEGFLYLVDRRSSLIITGGENVYPSEVEQVLARHPDVADVCVVGLPDDRWGEVVCAYVVARPGSAVPGVEDLRRLCAGQIAGYKQPRVVRAVDRVPRNPSGKVLRQALVAEPGRVAS